MSKSTPRFRQEPCFLSLTRLRRSVDLLHWTASGPQPDFDLLGFVALEKSLPHHRHLGAFPVIWKAVGYSTQTLTGKGYTKHVIRAMASSGVDKTRH